MNKVIATIIYIIVILGAIIMGMIIFNHKSNKFEADKFAKVDDLEEENILDDCTDEYEELEANKIVQANSKDEKISPYCSFTIKTYYKECGHIKSEYLKLPEELVNCTKEQIKEKYKEYTLEKFSSNEIVLYQEKEGQCDEHYIVKDDEGKVKIYKKEQNGENSLVEETDISTEYLTKTDIMNMEKGIEINGKQNLNQFIENFE